MAFKIVLMKSLTMNSRNLLWIPERKCMNSVRWYLSFFEVSLEQNFKVIFLMYFSWRFLRFLARISLNKGFILNETDFPKKIYIYIFRFFLPYGTYKNGPNFFLCIFNELIRSYSTCFRTITAASLCLCSLLSWFVSLLNKRPVFN